MSFTWDALYPRLTAFSDGSGTTSRSYGTVGQLGALRLARETAPSGLSVAYGYDSLGRVTTRTVAGLTETVGYDALGRVTAQTNPLGSFSRAYLGETGQLTADDGASWCHDAAGNLRDDGRLTYGWDAEHRLIAITDTATGQVSRFRYDALSRRVAITDNGVETRYLWCGETICAAHDLSGTVTARYIPQGEQSTAAGPLSYHRDHLGSVIRTVDAAGTVQGTTRYGAYGTTDAASGVQPSFGYAGMFRHSASGLYLTLYRAYDPASGRWLSRDPIEEVGGVNLYAYVGGDPVNWVDPKGLAGGRGERGATGGSSGKNSDNPYKHCKIDPCDPNKIICTDHQTGKKITKPKPADWDTYKSSSEPDPVPSTPNTLPQSPSIPNNSAGATAAILLAITIMILLAPAGI